VDVTSLIGSYSLTLREFLLMTFILLSELSMNLYA